MSAWGVVFLILWLSMCVYAVYAYTPIEKRKKRWHG